MFLSFLFPSVTGAGQYGSIIPPNHEPSPPDLSDRAVSNGSSLMRPLSGTYSVDSSCGRSATISRSRTPNPLPTEEGRSGVSRPSRSFAELERTSWSSASHATIMIIGVGNTGSGSRINPRVIAPSCSVIWVEAPGLSSLGPTPLFSSVMLGRRSLFTSTTVVRSTDHGTSIWRNGTHLQVRRLGLGSR